MRFPRANASENDDHDDYARRKSNRIAYRKRVSCNEIRLLLNSYIKCARNFRVSLKITTGFFLASFVMIALFSPLYF
jgi:hypothetical protein